jgi:hypothetical protein
LKGRVRKEIDKQEKTEKHVIENCHTGCSAIQDWLSRAKKPFTKDDR